MLPTWMQLPEDAGQIIDVHYAIDWEAELLHRRTVDRSDGTVSFEKVRIDGGKFEPWNGCLPNIVGEWEETATNEWAKEVSDEE